MTKRNGARGGEDGFSTIGRPMRKVDGLAKATGRARYTDDIRLPGMLHGKILRSPHPHARIVAIDTSRAEALEGVHAAVTGRDMPTTYGIIPWTPDEYPLCVDRVRYIGDGVAAVAAVDEDTANAALGLIDVTYEELPAYLDPHEAIAADSGPYIHEPRKPGWNGNITKVVKLAFGDVEAGLEDADLVVEGDYFFEGTTHTPIEPHCAIGLAEGNGKLTVWSATQVPHYLHRELARVLDVDPAQVRVIQPPVGGAFGGKSEPFDLEFCVAKLSMKTGRPGQDPLHAGRGLLLPPRPPPFPHALQDRRHPRRHAHRGRLRDRHGRGCLCLVRAGDDLLLRATAHGAPTRCPPTASTPPAPTRTNRRADRSGVTARSSRASPSRCSLTGSPRGCPSTPSNCAGATSSGRTRAP